MMHIELFWKNGVILKNPLAFCITRDDDFYLQMDKMCKINQRGINIISKTVKNVDAGRRGNFECAKVGKCDNGAWCGLDFEEDRALPPSVCASLVIIENGRKVGAILLKFQLGIVDGHLCYNRFQFWIFSHFKIEKSLMILL